MLQTNFIIILFLLYCTFVLSFTMTMTVSINNLSYIQISSTGVIRKWIYLLPLNLTFSMPFMSFSALKRLATKMRSTMHNNRLNHSNILVCASRKNSQLDTVKTANSFIVRKNSRNEQFKLLCNIRTDAVVDSE